MLYKTKWVGTVYQCWQFESRKALYIWKYWIRDVEIDTKLPAILVRTEPALRDEESFYFFGEGWGGVGRGGEIKTQVILKKVFEDLGVCCRWLSLKCGAPYRRVTWKKVFHTISNKISHSHTPVQLGVCFTVCFIHTNTLYRQPNVVTATRHANLWFKKKYILSFFFTVPPHFRSFRRFPTPLAPTAPSPIVHPL